MMLFSGLAAAARARGPRRTGRSAFRCRAGATTRLCVFLQPRRGSSARSSSRELFELARRALGLAPRRPAEQRKAMKLGVEYGEDAGAHDRRALESGGTASHESDEDLLHFCCVWVGRT